jgi:hypothetical protein
MRARQLTAFSSAMPDRTHCSSLSSFPTFSKTSLLIARPKAFAIADHGLILMGASWSSVSSTNSALPPPNKISLSVISQSSSARDKKGSPRKGAALRINAVVRR